MPPLPFRLRVPSREELRLGGVSTTSFRFRGLLHLGDDAVLLEWSGTARVERVGLTGIGDETLRLPDEQLSLPFGRLRDAILGGGWLWPRLLLMGNDLDALKTVPGEDGGRVALWLDRRDRRLAADMVERIRARL